MASLRGGEDILGLVTMKSTSVTTGPARFLRSSLRLSVPLAFIGTVLLAAPAMADLPEAWETPDEKGLLDILLFILVFPVAAAIVIALLSVLPALAKGEKLTGQSGTADDQWLGGPLGGTAEIEPSGAAKDAGGASGKW